MDKEEVKNFLEYMQDKVQDCYKEETRIAINRFLEGTNKMSADEMFEELGLWLEQETPFEFEVKNDDDKIIKINKERQEIACFNYYDYDGFEYLTLKELQAINKKVEELGWMK